MKKDHRFYYLDAVNRTAAQDHAENFQRDVATPNLSPIKKVTQFDLEQIFPHTESHVE